jgi:uncharacterized protein YjiS (DUF1127 family)
MTYASAFASAFEAMLPGGAAAPARPVGRLGAAVAGAVARRKAMAEYRQLLGREDHLLEDIGVTRDEVRAALRACRR